MDETHYKKALDAARMEMAELLPQHAAIEKRIAMLRQTIATLVALAEGSETDDDDQVYVPSPVELSTKAAVSGLLATMVGKNMALSDAIREVLKASGKPVTSMQVRDGLVRMGIDIEKKYTSPMAVIHKALKRLDGKGEVSSGTAEDGKTTYQWKTRYKVTPREIKKRG